MIVTFCKEQKFLERQLLRTDGWYYRQHSYSLNPVRGSGLELNFSRFCRPTLWSALAITSELEILVPILLTRGGSSGGMEDFLND